MNYALDALWWKLDQKNVRDLASLLTAPPLWHTGCELPVNRLLGETGFRYLLALNQNPEPLVSFLAQEFPHKFRLGFYAEYLLKFWLTYSPHWQLIAQNITVSENKQTIGAIDFIAQNKNTGHDTIYHLELTCKYYLSLLEKPTTESFIGFNQDDCLTKKIAKLTQQLELPNHPQFVLDTVKNYSDIENMSVVRGNAFSLSGILPSGIDLNPYAWAGKIVYADALSCSWQDKQFTCINSMDLLSPARVEFKQTIDFVQLRNINTPQIIALVDKRYDGFYHEQERFAYLSLSNA